MVPSNLKVFLHVYEYAGKQILTICVIEMQKENRGKQTFFKDN